MICKRCGYKTEFKHSLINHLKKKKECKPTNINNDIDRNYLIDELTFNLIKKYNCIFCGKGYDNRISKYNHQNKCDKTNMDNRAKAITFLIKKVDDNLDDITSKCLKELDIMKNKINEKKIEFGIEPVNNQNVNNTINTNGNYNNTNGNYNNTTNNSNNHNINHSNIIETVNSNINNYNIIMPFGNYALDNMVENNFKLFLSVIEQCKKLDADPNSEQKEYNYRLAFEMFKCLVQHPSNQNILVNNEDHSKLSIFNGEKLIEKSSKDVLQTIAKDIPFTINELVKQKDIKNGMDYDDKDYVKTTMDETYTPFIKYGKTNDFDNKMFNELSKISDNVINNLCNNMTKDEVDNLKPKIVYKSPLSDDIKKKIKKSKVVNKIDDIPSNLTSYMHFGKLYYKDIKNDLIYDTNINLLGKMNEVFI